LPSFVILLTYSAQNPHPLATPPPSHALIIPALTSWWCWPIPDHPPGRSYTQHLPYKHPPLAPQYPSTCLLSCQPTPPRPSPLGGVRQCGRCLVLQPLRLLPVQLGSSRQVMGRLQALLQLRTGGLGGGGGAEGGREARGGRVGSSMGDGYAGVFACCRAPLQPLAKAPGKPAGMPHLPTLV
jgi:hypothetical protein